MAHEERSGGLSRRRLIFSGATLAAAGVATGALVTTVTSSGGTHAAQADQNVPTPEEPVVVHLRDAQTGQLELFIGTRHVSFTDRGIAAQLARTAATAS